MKNIFKENSTYYEFLKQNNVDKNSFLWDKSTKNIKDLLILPNNCVEEERINNVYIVNCN